MNTLTLAIGIADALLSGFAFYSTLKFDAPKSYARLGALVIGGLLAISGIILIIHSFR